jgi:hypothetical protein
MVAPGAPNIQSSPPEEIRKIVELFSTADPSKVALEGAGLVHRPNLGRLGPSPFYSEVTLMHNDISIDSRGPLAERPRHQRRGSAGLFVAVLLVTCLVTNFASAAVIPPSAAGVEGISADETLVSSGGLTSQQFFHPADLSAILPGTLIYGLSLRLDEQHGLSHPDSYPQAEFTWTRFDIKLGQGKQAPDLTNFFAGNYVGAPTQVRTGPLTMGVDFFPSSSSPHAWSTLIAFDTPYLYMGGILALEVRLDGPAQTPLLIDSTSGGADINGRLIQANIGNDNANFANSVFYQGNWVVDLRTVPVPEPSTASLVLLGVAGLLALPRTRARVRSLIARN